MGVLMAGFCLHLMPTAIGDPQPEPNQRSARKALDPPANLRRNSHARNPYDKTWGKRRQDMPRPSAQSSACGLRPRPVPLARNQCDWRPMVRNHGGQNADYGDGKNEQKGRRRIQVAEYQHCFYLWDA
jgi:hypothetical protein